MDPQFLFVNKKDYLHIDSLLKLNILSLEIGSDLIKKVERLLYLLIL